MSNQSKEESQAFKDVSIWGGFILPIVPIAIGLHALLTRHTWFPGGWPAGAIVVGWPAVTAAVAWFGLALVLHSNFFWGRLNWCWPFADLAKVVSLFAIICGFGATAWWVFRSNFI